LLKESTIWTMKKFEDYIMKEKGVERKAIDELYKRMKMLFA